MANTTLGNSTLAHQALRQRDPQADQCTSDATACAAPYSPARDAHQAVELLDKWRHEAQVSKDFAILLAAQLAPKA